jgi:chemotaxis protein histidine kinase CheA
MSKTERVDLRLTSEEKQASIAKAKAWGLSLSQYIRVLLTMKAPPKQVTDVAWNTFSKLGETYGQLTRIGANLNQLSQTTNTQSKVPEHLSQELQRLDNILRDLQSLLLELRSQINNDS